MYWVEHLKTFGCQKFCLSYCWDLVYCMYFEYIRIVMQHSFHFSEYGFSEEMNKLLWFFCRAIAVCDETMGMFHQMIWISDLLNYTRLCYSCHSSRQSREKYPKQTCTWGTPHTSVWHRVAHTRVYCQKTLSVGDRVHLTMRRRPPKRFRMSSSQLPATYKLNHLINVSLNPL